MKVAIVGATGYGGAELVRILHRHPRVSIHSIYASSQFGSPLTDSFPHMQDLVEYKLEELDYDHVAKEVDVVFTATPSGVAAKIAPPLLERGVKVIDLSGDFRIKNSEVYEQWYKQGAADKQYVEEAVYGLTEWGEADLTQAQLIANPGCFPTSVLLGLAPLVKNEKIDPSTIIVDAKTGVSGAGKGLSSATHYAETNDNFKIYKVNQHQHTPEIEEKLQGWNSDVGAITFSTHLAPMTRGIMSTIYATASNKTSAEALLALYEETYKDSPFVRIRKENQFPSTKEVYGSNFCDISLTYDERTNRITVVSVIDNLVKGASGQAVQNMNKMFGFDETMGIDFMPVFP